MKVGPMPAEGGAVESDHSGMSQEEQAWYERPLPETYRSGFVVLIGRPNVGKSTLMNHYLGEKIAIVSPKPQTTRNRLLGILTRPDAQIIFADTPGLHHPRHKLSEFMVAQAWEALSEGDVILWMVDASAPVGPDDRRIGEVLEERHGATPVVMALNKIDRLPDSARRQERLEAYRRLATFAEVLPISALRGLGTEALLTTLIDRLPLGPLLYPPDQLSDQQTRFIAAEIIREKLLLALRDEIPHATAVWINTFKERPNGMIYIAADILVERDSQKRIVLGRKGQQIKQIGSAARTEIQQFLGQKVYLELWVKVRKHWRRNEQILRHIGYPPPGDKKKRHLPQW